LSYGSGKKCRVENAECRMKSIPSHMNILLTETIQERGKALPHPDPLPKERENFFPRWADSAIMG
jgi:hypothetical protein